MNTKDVIAGPSVTTIGMFPTDAPLYSSGDKVFDHEVFPDHLGISNQSAGKFLTPIYQEEIAAGNPDVTLVAVSAATGFGKFNSQGAPACSKTFDPSNPVDVQAYKNELDRVYDYWIRQPVD